MEYLFQLSAALLPAVLLLLYVYHKDPMREPLSWLACALLLGVVICLPVSVVEVGIQQLLFGGAAPKTLFGTTAEAFFVAALPEESFKLLALWLVLRRNPYYDEHFDGIVYAVFVGLGFAAIENVMYVFGNSEEWMSVAFSRALLSVPGHYAFAVLMGYYYSMYRFVRRTPMTAFCVLAVPFAAHGFYDALAMSGQVDPVIGSVAFIALVWFCVKMHKLANRKVMAQLRKDEDEVFVVS